MISTKPLTTTNLNLMLKNFDIFMGTFPSDQIQIQKRCYPQAFIVNTEPSTSVGEHWTALIVSDKKCLFFDPLGCEMLNVFLLETLKSVGKYSLYLVITADIIALLLSYLSLEDFPIPVLFITLSVN